MEYYLALNSETLTHIITLMNPENMLSEQIDAKEQISFDSTSVRFLKQSMPYRWEQNVGFQVLGGGEESFHLMGVLAWNGGKVLKTVVIVVRQCEYMELHGIVHTKNG